MIQENTNKALFINSIILYSRMILTTICALLTTRYAMKALGVVDFGLFSVIGGIVSFVGVFNTIMLSSSNRYISVAVGKGDVIEINKTFNVLLVIFFIIAGIMLIVFPLGYWYINQHIQYNGAIRDAQIVFAVSILGAMCSAIAVPYNGLLIAKEKFLVFSLVDVLSHIFRMLVAYVLIDHFSNKLVIYAITISLLTAIPTLIYWIYSRKYFRDLVKWNFIRDITLYKEILSFSGWVSYGAFAHMAKSQGASLIINKFFDTVMNSALGLANSINLYVTMFANSISQPMAPQITKSYAKGDIIRTNDLLVMSTKYSFMVMFLIGMPLIVSCEWILNVWLGEVPPYAVSFTVLLIIDNIVLSFNSGISNLIFASGKIKLYQLLINTVRLLSVVAGFFVLKSGFPPEFLLIVYILFSLIVVLLSQWILNVTLNFDNRILFKRSYMPSILIIICSLPILFLRPLLHPVINCFLTFIYVLSLEFIIALSSQERTSIINMVRNKLNILS